MTIHFVCRGNTYRSRLAETYLNSKQLPNFKAISSGIEANRNISGPISWYSQKLIQQNHLVPFEKTTWDQTTRQGLEKSDYVIFMNSDIYEYCHKNLGFNSKNLETWDILDTNNQDPRWQDADEDERIKITEETYGKIKQKVEDLLFRLGQPKEKSE